MENSSLAAENCLSQLSIKTRIETGFRAMTLLIIVSLSQLSIKTRIETQDCHVYSRVVGCLSQLSIKTRIETHWKKGIINLPSLFESAIH